MLMEFTLLVLGIIAITFAADIFVDGASGLARILGISPLLIGLTIVALGTSAPEIFVAITSAYRGNIGLAIGNVLGSNIANIALVLGLCACFKPLIIHSTLLKKEYPILLITTLTAWLLLRDSNLSYLDGVILLLGLIILLAWLIYTGIKNSNAKIADEYQQGLTFEHKKIKILGKLLLGLILLPVSSEIIVSNASAIANYLQISELVIGLTVIAIGTSLPEIATAIAATIKNEHDLLIGNIIGSNLFNILAVLPFPAFINPSRIIPGNIHRDLIMVFLITILFFVFAFGRKGNGKITRTKGGILLTIYACYITYIAIG